MKNVGAGFLIGIVVVGLLGAWWYVQKISTTTATRNEETPSAQQPVVTKKEAPRPQPPSASIGDENAVHFACAGGKSLEAVFRRDIVGLTLSDGRQLELRQWMVGSGIRYVNADESIEFRGKGEDGYIIENGVTTYADCAT